jgi:hypothetical protein
MHGAPVGEVRAVMRGVQNLLQLSPQRELGSPAAVPMPCPGGDGLFHAPAALTPVKVLLIFVRQEGWVVHRAGDGHAGISTPFFHYIARHCNARGIANDTN